MRELTGLLSSYSCHYADFKPQSIHGIADCSYQTLYPQFVRKLKDDSKGQLNNKESSSESTNFHYSNFIFDKKSMKVYEWLWLLGGLNRSKVEREEIEDGSCSGWPITQKINKNIENLVFKCWKNCQLNIYI